MRRAHKQARRDDHAFDISVIKMKADNGRMSVRSARRTARSAEDCVWDLLTREGLTREGGEVRVRQGRRVVAQGVGFEEPDALPRLPPTDCNVAKQEIREARAPMLA